MFPCPLGSCAFFGLDALISNSSALSHAWPVRTILLFSYIYRPISLCVKMVSSEAIARRPRSGRADGKASVSPAAAVRSAELLARFQSMSSKCKVRATQLIGRFLSMFFFWVAMVILRRFYPSQLHLFIVVVSSLQKSLGSLVASGCIWRILLGKDRMAHADLCRVSSGIRQSPEGSSPSPSNQLNLTLFITRTSRRQRRSLRLKDSVTTNIL